MMHGQKNIKLNSKTVIMASAVDLPAVKPYCSDGIWPVVSRK